MRKTTIKSLSHSDLRDRLQAYSEELGNSQPIDLMEILRYLTSLPDHVHTPDSIDAVFHLSRGFYRDSRPVQTIQAAALAARLAIPLDQKHLLCKVRGMEGIALCDLGRFSEAAVVYADFWTLARSLGDVVREILAVKNVGGLYCALAQWDVAFSYLQRSCDLAVKHGHAHLELGSRVNMANCALQLNDPASGLRTLLPFTNWVPKLKREAATQALVHITLAHLYLAVGEIGAAQKHAHESARWVKLAEVKRTTQLHKALLGLIDVKCGKREAGLAALERGLAFAKRVDNMDVVDYLGMCADACESAGESERALSYLHELVAWKKKLIEAQIPHYEGLTDPSFSRSGTSIFDDNLRIRAESLQAGVGQQIRCFIEVAIDAEITNGYDLYRTFRVAKLARLLAVAIGWDDERTSALALGAQLSNIGMMAIPTRVLHKPSELSESERQILRSHPLYGAELLRRPKLRVLDVASIVAAQHHERFDGSGYPHGLKGAAISEEARIVAVCEAFDAMTHKRHRRPVPLGVEEAFNELEERAGSQFDPTLVRAFVSGIRCEFGKHQDFDAFLSEGADDVEYVRARARMETLIADGG